jgi:hypothetical protein
MYINVYEKDDERFVAGPFYSVEEALFYGDQAETPPYECKYLGRTEIDPNKLEPQR